MDESKTEAGRAVGSVAAGPRRDRACCGGSSAARRHTKVAQIAGDTTRRGRGDRSRRDPRRSEGRRDARADPGDRARLRHRARRSTRSRRSGGDEALRRRASIRRAKPRSSTRWRSAPRSRSPSPTRSITLVAERRVRRGRRRRRDQHGSRLPERPAVSRSSGTSSRSACRPAWKLASGNGVIVAVLDTGVAYENYKDVPPAPRSRRA